MRGILDLHGKKLADGTYEGRTTKPAKYETLAFIILAFENFQREVNVITGRGKHSKNLRPGKLYQDFPTWIKPLIEKNIIHHYMSLEGDGGYRVQFKKPHILDLTSVKLDEQQDVFNKAINDIAGLNKGRLFVHYNLLGTSKRGIEFLQDYLRMVWDNPKPPTDRVPISFDDRPSVLKLIFNHKNMQSLGGETWGSFDDSYRTYGTYYLPASNVMPSV